MSELAHGRHEGSVTWAPVDDDTGDLLTELAEIERHDNEHEADRDAAWMHFLDVCRTSAAEHGGQVRQNHIRDQLRELISPPQRISALFQKALKSHVLIPTGVHDQSNDRRGRNGGKPYRIYRFQEPSR